MSQTTTSTCSSSPAQRPTVIYIYIYIYIYICQDGGAVGFIDFTKLSFALSSLAQPVDQIGSVPEYVFVILSSPSSQIYNSAYTNIYIYIYILCMLR